MCIEKFQPSNGTVGASFIADWCGTCEHGKHEPCDIAVRTMWLKVEDADYPVEWRYVDGNPVCTAHVELGQPLPEPRCEHTVDMFNGCTEFGQSVLECLQ